VDGADGLVYAATMDSDKIDDISTQIVTIVGYSLRLLFLSGWIAVCKATNIGRLLEDCRDQNSTGTPTHHCHQVHVVVVSKALDRQHYDHGHQISDAVCYRWPSLPTQMCDVRVDDKLNQIAGDEGYQDEQAVCCATT